MALLAAAPRLAPDTCRLYVVRHGETAWNVAGLLQGQLDTILNERGHRQAEAAADYLVRHLGHGGIAAVYSSDLARTMDTASPIAARFGLRIRRDRRLRETHFGHWQGLRWDQIETEHGAAHAQWRSDPDFAVSGGGESRRARFHRVCVALHSIAMRHVGQHVVVVTHSGIVDDVGRLLHRAPWDRATRLAKVNAGISVCEFRPSAGARETHLGSFRVHAAGNEEAELPDHELEAAASGDLRDAFPLTTALDPARAAETLGDWSLLHWGLTDHLAITSPPDVVAMPPHAAATSSAHADTGATLQRADAIVHGIGAGDSSDTTDGQAATPALAPAPVIDAAATDDEARLMSAV